MATIDIGADTYTVYADDETADVYAAAAIHAATWRASDLPTKAMALVTSTRLLDRQRWKEDYDTFAERSVVQNIIDASIEIAIALVDGSEVQNQQTTAEKIRSMSAGSVSISFMRGVDTPVRFPQIVQELLRDYLAGSGALFVPKAVGVDTESSFPIDLGFSPGGL